MTREPEEIRADLEETRERMGETLEVLSERTDLKARARQKVAGGVSALRERVRPAGSAGAGAGDGDASGRPSSTVLWLGGLAAGFVLGLLLPSGRGGAA